MNVNKRTGVLASCAVLSVLLLGAGCAKLAGLPNFHQSFVQMGLPAWTGYFTGACEVAAAVGLWIPRLRRLAAAGVCLLLVGALGYHLSYTPPIKGLPAAVMLALSLFVLLAGRGPQAAATPERSAGPAVP